MFEDLGAGDGLCCKFDEPTLVSLYVPMVKPCLKKIEIVLELL